MLNFKDQEKTLLVEQGKLEDEKSRDFIRGALGLQNKIVESSRHTILSGPPGVGKSYGTVDEINKAKVKHLFVPPGISDIDLAMRLSYAVWSLKEDEELVVVLDDADDVVFGDYKTLNKWKIAMGDIDYSLGIIPHFNHPVSMTNTMVNLEKAGKTDLLAAVSKHQSPDSIGLSIPMDKVRFVVLCNLDLEDPKSFSSRKIRSAVEPVLDRFNYKRMDLDWEKQWGWLAYVLATTQPFDEASLDNEEKIDLLKFMYNNWKVLRSTSYRTVRRLAEAVINFPDDYEGKWKNELKGH
tara:strand:+ start:229 stop:1113 length:885 start_codon:yes stop_codon:yes gene_type:complete